MGFFDWLLGRREHEPSAPPAPSASRAATFDDALSRATSEHDDRAQFEAGRTLATLLDRGAAAFTQIDRGLDELRKSRRFWAIRGFTDQILADDEVGIRGGAALGSARDEQRAAAYARLFGPRGLRIRLHALIETGELEQALRVAEAFRSSFDPMVADYEEEAREVLGLKGRIFKQRYVDSAAAGLFQPNLLRNAISAYAEGFARTEPRSLWHGVNVLALIERARRDGVQPPPDSLYEAGPLAGELLALANSPACESDPWRHISAAEVCWGLGRWEEAETYLGRHVAETISLGDGVRDIESTLRQLREVWRVDEGPDAARGAALIAQLNVALGRATSQTEVTAAPVQPAQHPSPGALITELDRRLNASRQDGAQMQTFEWVGLLQQRGRAVALVCDKPTKRGYGSGFLMRGEDLSEQWRGRVVFVTNYHVVNAVGGQVQTAWSLRPDQAEAVFTQCADSAPVAFERILWQSKAEAHDTCILELSRVPNDAAPIPLSAAQEGSYEAVTVLGHPEGRHLHLALENRAVVAASATPAEGARAICYTAPTSGGCSGGPVLDWHDLTVVALHHKKLVPAQAESANTGRDRRAPPAAPPPDMNEGILFASIRDGVARAPGGFAV